eukprot:12921320-Alexandrium_andersonii.AAC.1
MSPKGPSAHECGVVAQGISGASRGAPPATCALCPPPPAAARPCMSAWRYLVPVASWAARHIPSGGELL